MTDLPKRYRPHATRPQSLAVCIDCSGNPEAVIPLDAVPAHEDWHAVLLTGGQADRTAKVKGEWPDLAGQPLRNAADDLEARLDAVKRFVNAHPRDVLAVLLVEELGPDRLVELLDEAEQRVVRL